MIASGGVGCLDDLERLAGLPIAGCIVGRALYEGRFSLARGHQPGRTQMSSPASIALGRTAVDPRSHVATIGRFAA